MLYYYIKCYFLCKSSSINAHFVALEAALCSVAQGSNKESKNTTLRVGYVPTFRFICPQVPTGGWQQFFNRGDFFAGWNVCLRVVVVHKVLGANDISFVPLLISTPPCPLLSSL